MHWVIENVGDHFAPIEEALANVFIPALLGGKEGEQLRELFTLLVLPNPAKRAKDGYRASLECTKALTASLIARKDLDANGYASNVKRHELGCARRRRCVASPPSRRYAMLRTNMPPVAW